MQILILFHLHVQNVVISNHSHSNFDCTWILKPVVLLQKQKSFEHNRGHVPPVRHHHMLALDNSSNDVALAKAGDPEQQEVCWSERI